MKCRISKERLTELINLHVLAGAPPTELGKILFDLQEAHVTIDDQEAALDVAKQYINRRDMLMRNARSELAKLCARVTPEVREEVRSIMRGLGE